MSTAAPSLKERKITEGKWKCGKEPSGAKSHQCFHVVLIKERETGGGGESVRREEEVRKMQKIKEGEMELDSPFERF